MLTLASRLIGAPVLSMQASGRVASIYAPIIDPDSLKIVAFFLAGIRGPANILDAKSIREYSPYGAVVDSEDEFVERSDVIKIDKIIGLNFRLVGLKVETKKGSHLGKVSDFTVTSDNFSVQQIIVRRPLLKSFSDASLTIPRSEIVEVTDTKIIVKDEEKVIKARAEKEDFIPNFVNPFRNPELSHAPARTKTPDDTDTE